jgi:photosystem II stability/assembly factor-like uncharacterized protein
MSGNAVARMRATRSRSPSTGRWLGSIRRGNAAGAIIAAAALAVVIAGCGTRPALGARGAHRGPSRAVLTATFRLPGIFGLAAGDGAAWVTTGNAVLRIDPRTDRASQVVSDPGASLTGIAFGAGSLWVEGATGLLRVDPVTGKVTARIGVHGFVLSFGEGALWALGHIAGGPLVRIDPATNAVRTFPLPAGKTWDLAAGEGAVWLSVTMPSVGLLRVDPANGRVIARISGDHLSGQVAVGDGAVWASDGTAVARIDPRTSRVTATAWLLSPLPASGPSPVLNGSGLLAVAPGVVWTTRAGNARQASVLRLDLRTGRFTGAGLGVGRQPQAVAASGTTLWVVTVQGLARVDLAACGHSRCARPAPPALLPAAQAPVWLDSLQMVSARDGWALAWTNNPASPVPAALVPVHTTDGGRTWTAVSPAPAKPLLAPAGSDVVLLAVSPGRAWLALTLTRSGARPAVTEVFGTRDGGRSWTRSAPIHPPGAARWLGFSDPAHGWLLQDLGAAMGNNPVQLYRTSDGGRHWSLIAASPRLNQARTGRGTLPSACDKTGITFATPADGWLTGACFSLADAVLAAHDGGAHWAPQALPLPADTCMPDGCLISPPHFFGRTGFLMIARGQQAPYLLATQDTGTTWHVVSVPRAAGPFRSAQFFSARQGLLIPGLHAPGRVFYLTSDGGHTWTPVRQGIGFQANMTVNFVSPDTGFAWNPDTSGAPPIYATTNGGRTWTSYLPQLSQARPIPSRLGLAAFRPAAHGVREPGPGSGGHVGRPQRGTETALAGDQASRGCHPPVVRVGVGEHQAGPAGQGDAPGGRDYPQRLAVSVVDAGGPVAVPGGERPPVDQLAGRRGGKVQDRRRVRAQDPGTGERRRGGAGHRAPRRVHAGHPDRPGEPAGRRAGVAEDDHPEVVSRGESAAPVAQRELGGGAGRRVRHREDRVELRPEPRVDGPGRQRLEDHRAERHGVVERGPGHEQAEAVPPGGCGCRCRAEPGHARRPGTAVMAAKRSVEEQAVLQRRAEDGGPGADRDDPGRAHAESGLRHHDRAGAVPEQDELTVREPGAARRAAAQARVIEHRDQASGGATVQRDPRQQVRGLGRPAQGVLADDGDDRTPADQRRDRRR